jgi:hypothetical protein
MKIKRVEQTGHAGPKISFPDPPVAGITELAPGTEP